MATTQASSILLSAADVTWGRRERTCVAFVDQSAGTYDGTYFNVNAPTANGVGDAEFYIWFNLDAGSVDPAPAGRTGIEVAVTSGDSASDIATAAAAAIDADANFRGAVDTSNSAQVLIDSAFIGAVTAAADVDSGLDIEQVTQGIGGDLGRTSGGVEISFEQEAIDITTDQTGGIIVDSVQTGAAVTVTMSLIEMTPARWKTVVGSVSGDSFTPVGGTEVVGFGESRVYTSLFDLGGELILKPTRFPDSDRRYNITLFKSAPLPQSINFSGEDPQLMEVEFRGLANRELQTAINILGFGDSTQDLRL